MSFPFSAYHAYTPTPYPALLMGEPSASASSSRYISPYANFPVSGAGSSYISPYADVPVSSSRSKSDIAAPKSTTGSTNTVMNAMNDPASSSRLIGGESSVPSYTAVLASGTGSGLAVTRKQASGSTETFGNGVTNDDTPPHLLGESLASGSNSIYISPYATAPVSSPGADIAAQPSASTSGSTNTFWNTVMNSPAPENLAPSVAGSSIAVHIPALQLMEPASNGLSIGSTNTFWNVVMNNTPQQSSPSINRPLNAAPAPAQTPTTGSTNTFWNVVRNETTPSTFPGPSNTNHPSALQPIEPAHVAPPGPINPFTLPVPVPAIGGYFPFPPTLSTLTSFRQIWDCSVCPAQRHLPPLPPPTVRRSRFRFKTQAQVEDDTEPAFDHSVIPVLTSASQIRDSGLTLDTAQDQHVTALPSIRGLLDEVTARDGYVRGQEVVKKRYVHPNRHNHDCISKIDGVANHYLLAEVSKTLRQHQCQRKDRPEASGTVKRDLEIMKVQAVLNATDTDLLDGESVMNLASEVSEEVNTGLETVRVQTVLNAIDEVVFHGETSGNLASGALSAKAKGKRVAQDDEDVGDEESLGNLASSPLSAKAKGKRIARDNEEEEEDELDEQRLRSIALGALSAKSKRRRIARDDDEEEEKGEDELDEQKRRSIAAEALLESTQDRSNTQNNDDVWDIYTNNSTEHQHSIAEQAWNTINQANLSDDGSESDTSNDTIVSQRSISQHPPSRDAPIRNDEASNTADDNRHYIFDHRPEIEYIQPGQAVLIEREIGSASPSPSTPDLVYTDNERFRRYFSIGSYPVDADNEDRVYYYGSDSGRSDGRFEVSIDGSEGSDEDVDMPDNDVEEAGGYEADTESGGFRRPSPAPTPAPTRSNKRNATAGGLPSRKKIKREEGDVAQASSDDDDNDNADSNYNSDTSGRSMINNSCPAVHRRQALLEAGWVFDLIDGRPKRKLPGPSAYQRRWEALMQMDENERGHICGFEEGDHRYTIIEWLRIKPTRRPGPGDIRDPISGQIRPRHMVDDFVSMQDDILAARWKRTCYRLQNYPDEGIRENVWGYREGDFDLDWEEMKKERSLRAGWWL